MNAAIDLYLEHGMEATSLRSIAEELGVTKAALYYHFPSKLDLIQSVAAPVLEGMDQLINDMESSADLTPRQALEAYFDFTVEHLKVYQMMMRNPGIMTHLDMVPTFLGWRRRFEVLLVGPDASTEERVMATIAFGGVSDCIMMLQDIPTPDLRELAVRTACRVLDIRMS